MIHARKLGVALICALTCFVAGAKTVTAQDLLPFPQVERLDPEIIFDDGSPWWIWASLDGPPPQWPLASAPAVSRNVTDLLPVEEHESPDRRLDYTTGLVGSEPWSWTQSMAPIIARSLSTHQANSDLWERYERRRVRRGNPPPQQTLLLYSTGDEGPTTGGMNDPHESGLSNLYAVRTFDVEDPSRWAALQLNLEFSTGIIVFLNGVEVGRHHIRPGLEAFGNVATPYWLPDHVNQTTASRWEMTWMGIDPGLLVPGENVLAVAVYKRPSGGRRAIYFDMSLEGYTEPGMTKTPYLQSLDTERIVVMWETNVPAYGYVEYGPEGGDFVRVATSANIAGSHQEVVLEDLEPDTRYFYRVHSVPVSMGTNPAPESFASETRHFVTADDTTDDFTFVAYGDNRTQSEIHLALAEQMWQDIQREDARFILSTGDLTTNGSSWHEWHDEFFQASLPLMGYTPYYTSLGNHEGNHEMYYRYMSLPGNEAWYSFEYGNAEFFALNSSFDYTPGSEQLNWLENALAASDAMWKIVFFHHPPYACTPSRKPGDEEIQAYVVPVLEQLDVDLVLLGHDHLYGRSINMNGVTYVITGGGGAPSYPAEPDHINEVCVREFHYCIIDIDGDRLELRAVALGGVELDRLELRAD